MRPYQEILQSGISNANNVLRKDDDKATSSTAEHII